MAKKNETPVTPETTTPAPEVKEEVKETAIVAQQPTMLAPVAAPNEMFALAERLPDRYKEDVMLLKRPTIPEMVGIVGKLPQDVQDRLMEMIRRTRPKKQGVHTQRQGFEPVEIRINQGAGNDPARPKNSVPGNFYTADSKNIESPFVGALIAIYEGRILWPPKDSGNSDGEKKEGGRMPLCISMDRVMGSRYGVCAACPQANKPWNQGGCAKEVVAFVVDKDLTNIYQVRFSKTSLGAGENLKRIASKSDEIWSRWFTFETVERTGGNNSRYFVMKTTPVADSRNPANEHTPNELHPLFSMFSRVIDADVYFPALANIYDHTKAQNNESAPGESANEAELLNNASKPAGDNPDYSTDV